MIPDDATILATWHAGRLGELICETMEPLVGEPFQEFGRAGDMMWLGFGDTVAAPTRRNPERLCARHRLNVSCPLRLDSPTGVLVASADIYRPAADVESLEGFDWSQRDANVFDACVSAYWTEHPPGSTTVARISADPVGGLILDLSNGHAVRIFPTRSGPGELWRYFGINDEEHFVVLPDVGRDSNGS